MKEGKKVVIASSEGVLSLFSWDWFGDCNDRIVGHPNSICCMVKYDEDTLITGGEDGLIRVVSVLPNRIIAIVGDALDQDEGFHIQSLSLIHDKKLIACFFPCRSKSLSKKCQSHANYASIHNFTFLFGFGLQSSLNQVLYTHYHLIWVKVILM